MSDGVRVRHLKAALLQVIAEIQHRAADKKRAFRIDYHAHTLGLDENVTVGRTIDQIHLVLQPRTTAADHRDPQRTVRAPLFLEKRNELARSILRYPDEAFVADLIFDIAVWRRYCGHGGI